MTQHCKDTLEKIDKARSEGLYHEVRVHSCRGEGWGGGMRGDWGEDGEANQQVVFS